MRLSDARQAWQRWQSAAGPWQGWSVCPVLLAPQVETITPVPAELQLSRGADALAASLAATLDTDRATLILSDLAPVLGVSLAAQLYRYGLAYPLLILPRWPYARAVLPVAELLHALVRLAPASRPGELNHVCLVIDAERGRALPDRSPRDARADNRYRLVPYDLPNLAALRSHGIRRVVKVARP